MAMGLTVNVSIIEQDGDYDIGFHYEDTDGRDIDYLLACEKENIQETLYDLMEDFTADYVEQTPSCLDEDEEESDEEVDEYIRKLEETIDKLVEENNSLKTDLNILQRRADDAVNKSMNKDKESLSRVYSLWDLFDLV